jgi:methyl-accepting chemotaxis protein
MEQIRSRLRSWSIRSRLMATCFGLALMTGLVGLLGIWAFSTIDSAFQVTATENLPAVDHLLQADRDMQQALVAERSLMFMSMATARAKEQVKAHGDKLENAKAHWKNYTALAASAAEKQIQPAFEAAFGEWGKTSREVIKILSQDTPEARRDAVDLSMGDGAAKFEAARKSLVKLSELRLTQARTYASAHGARAAVMRRWVVVSVVGALALAFILSFILGRYLGRSFGRIVNLLKDIAEGEGDLTARLDASSADEIGEMAKWFNIFVEKIQDTVRAIARHAHDVARSSAELSLVSAQLSSTSEQTSAQAGVASAASEEVSKNIQTVSAGTEMMSASIKEIAKNATEAATVAKEAVQVSEQTNHTINKLGASSAEIGNVIKTITSIAEQTNLLALNATIEAARAGEAGKGFAVVANEVKELAKQTGKATEDISRKIAAIQHNTHAAVDAIGTIGTVINHINDIANTIASAVDEQSATTAEISRNVAEAAQGAGEITLNVAGVSQATRSTSSGATDTQNAAAELSRMANELQTLVAKFKYDEGGQSMGSAVYAKDTMPKTPRKQTPPAYKPAGATLHAL